MAEYNPMFISGLSLSQGAPSESLGFEPIQRFGRYQVQNPDEAVKLMTSEDFLKFWNKQNISKEGIGYRVQTSRSDLFPQGGAYQRPDYAKGIATADELINKAYPSEWTPDMTPRRPTGKLDEFGRKELVPVPVEEQAAARQGKIDIAKAKARNLARIDNRFFTPLEAAEGTRKPLQEYLGFAQRSQAAKAGESLPIKIITEENLPAFSLKGNNPFGAEVYDPADFQRRMAGLKGSKLLPKYGIELGVSVSSNPQDELFVPKRLGQTKLEGGVGAARRVGNTLPSGAIELFGAPKVSVPMQALGNVNRVGGAVLERAAAPVGLGLMAYGATRDNYYDRETGFTDPFAIRPLVDFAGKVTGLYEDQSTKDTGLSIAQAWREAQKQVADPEWVKRNQIGAIPYNMILNTGDFIQGMKDAYVPLWQSSANTAPEVSTFIGF